MALAVESVFIDVVLNGKKAQMGLKQFNKQLRALNKPIKTMNGMFGKMFRLAGFAGFTKMAFDAQKLGRELGLISDKTGIAASKISKMQSAFAATGGDAKSLSNVLTNITAGLSRLSVGNGEMAAKLAAMNISAWDEGGGLKSADVVLGDIAEWTKSQIDMGRSLQEVSQYLQDNFGIQQDLANQLALGRGGFRSYQEQMAKKVGSLQESEIKNLKSLNASFSRLMATVGVLSDKIVATLSPVLEFFIDLFQNGMRNIQGIFEEIANLGKDIDISAFKEIFKFLKDLSGGFADAVKLTIDALFMLGGAIGEVAAGVVKAVETIYKALKAINDWLHEKVDNAKEGFWRLGAIGKETASEKGALVQIRKLEQQGQYDLANEMRRRFNLPVVENFVPYAEGLNRIEKSSGGDYYIEIDNNTTINANGNVQPEEIGDAVDESNNRMVGQAEHLVNGGY